MVQSRYTETRAPTNVKPGTVLNVVDIRDVAFSYVDSQGIVRVGFARVYGKPGQEAVAGMNPDKIEENYVELSPSIKAGILQKLGALGPAGDVKPEDLPDGVPGGTSLNLGES